MTHHARASFRNLSHDQAPYDEASPDPSLSRMHIEREFTGDLAGHAAAELLACQPTQDVFGYVGMDRFTGTLNGHSGSFVFQHGALHDSGHARIFGYIVSGSGTGELEGIRGDVTISVTAEGEHSIEVDFDRP